MRFTIVAALGAANMASAQFVNTTATTSNLPDVAGDFKFYACMSAIPGFSKVATSEAMNVDLCAASCPTKFMAVAGKECACGDLIKAATNIQKFDKVACKANAMRRRQDSDSGVTVSVYERSGDMDDMTDTYSSSTMTITTTQVATITTCAPSVTDCPIGATTTMTMVQPSPSPDCEHPAGWEDWHKKKIVCYGDYCGPEYPGKSGDQKYRVICNGEYCYTEVCETPEWNMLVICNGQECKYASNMGSDDKNKDRKIVCYDGKCVYGQCMGDECEKKFVCKGDQCKHTQCSGGDQCYQKVICDANGQNCYLAPPATGPYGPGAAGPNGPGAAGPNGPGAAGPNGPGSSGPYGPGSAGPNGPSGSGPYGPPGSNGGVSCNGVDCVYIQPNPAASGVMPGGNGGQSTGLPVVVGAATGMAANIIGAIAGLLFVL